MKLEELMNVLENVETIIIKDFHSEEKIVQITYDDYGDVTEKLRKFYALYFEEVKRAVLRITHKESIEITIFLTIN